MAATLYYLGDFEKARQHAMDGVHMLHSGCVEPQTEELDEPAIACLCHEALCAWHFGESPSCHSSIAEAVSLARELGDIHGLAVALYFGAILRQMDRDPRQVERMVSELICRTDTDSPTSPSSERLSTGGLEVSPATQLKLSPASMTLSQTSRQVGGCFAFPIS
jgi:hypothetical protein